MHSAARRSSALLVSMLPACALLLAALFAALPARASGDLVVYGDSLSAGWADWSWSAANNFANASPALGGSGDSIAVTLTGWGGLSLHAPSPVATAPYSAVHFYIYGGSGGTHLTFYTQSSDGGGNSTQLNLAAPAALWTPFTLTMAALGSPAAIARLNFQDSTGSAQPSFYVDDIRLLGAPLHVTATIQIDAGAAGTTFVPSHLLGSNLPSWLGPATLADATFRARMSGASIGVLRIPGGSWSDGYGWASCEAGTDLPGRAPCGWSGWEARPSDFIKTLRAQHAEGMWTVNINTTAQEAAAAVAFFNARITDTASIGVDIHGTDWYTSGHWALLRATNGSPEPLGLHYWEFGNEVYGGLPGHTNCQSWGWETTWTCDGTEYINGVGSGSARHEGYLEFRAAMRAVDPSIAFGVSGTDDPAGYASWATKVISAAGQVMDFYVVHPYAYDTLPGNDAAGYAQILALPQAHWSGIRAALKPLFDQYAPGRAVPLAATEFNLVSSWTGDNALMMTRAVNTLYLADSIGQMAESGYALALQWAVADGTQSNGTSYGLLKSEPGYTRTAQYYALPLWARFGKALLPISSSADAATELSVYAGHIDSAAVTLLAINKTANPFTATVTLAGVPGLALSSGTVDVVQASSLGAQVVTLNGVANPSDDLSSAPAHPFAVGPGTAFNYAFTPNSITLLTLHLAGVAAPRRLYIPLLLR